MSIKKSIASRPPFVEDLFPTPPEDRPRFLSAADCQAIAQRLAQAAHGGGFTTIGISSAWTGFVRWARNQISAAGEIRENYIEVVRDLNGAINTRILFNDTSEEGLVAAARRAERVARLKLESPQHDLMTRFQNELIPTPAPTLFSDATYQLGVEPRAAAARALAQQATAAGMLSAGYIEVRARSVAVIDTLGNAERYVQFTTARMSATVRDPTGTGSGWAGVDWQDWYKINAPNLMAIAVDKCLRSRKPVAIEPGRYTTVLEPQAVGDVVSTLFEPYSQLIDQYKNWKPDDSASSGPFALYPRSHFQAKREQRVVDSRVTISTDPGDLDLAYPAFNPFWGDFSNGHVDFHFGPTVVHPVVWIEQGVLKTLAYGRGKANEWFHQNTGQPNPGGFRMSGGDTTVEEMIATTKRGLLVTRFDSVQLLDEKSVLLRGYTRDGLWLIEDGKISKAVKNLAFTESLLFMLNNLEQLGVPQRVLHVRGSQRGNIWDFIPNNLGDMPQPVIVPPLKIKDFSFTALTDAI